MGSIAPIGPSSIEPSLVSRNKKTLDKKMSPSRDAIFDSEMHKNAFAGGAFSGTPLGEGFTALPQTP